MADDKNSNWGGARLGAGRKTGWRKDESLKGRKTPYVNITVSGSPEEIDNIKRLAKENNKSVSRFIIESVL